jgi:predicted Ser/Thr protein kinase
MQNTTASKFLMCFPMVNGDHIDRYLFDDDKVRYITIKKSAYKSHSHAIPLPPVPAGDWNCGTVDKDPDTGQPHFSNTEVRRLPGVESTWHGVSSDLLELELYGEQSDSKIYMPSKRDSSGRLMVVKMAQDEDDIPRIQKECDIYEQIQGRGIAPDFLGYVTEEGRIIGFAIEKIEGAQGATGHDIDACEAVLERLHDLNIAHGDTHGLNFLIKDDRAWLIDFERSEIVSDPGAFESDVTSIRFETSTSL